MTNQATERLRTSQVAHAAGVNQQTLRYYERRGLLTAPDRSPGGHRLYDPDTVTILRVIKAAQRLGFTLDEVADLLEGGRHHHRRPRNKALQHRMRTKLAEIDARIEDLHTIRSRLTDALEAGCDDMVACSSAQCCPIPFTDLVSTNPAATKPATGGSV
ncbi:MAG: MerR family transcriptional regulator [Nocardioidaceae bacterium]